jgi:GNAT superfamily N-acetyltransferase
MQVRAAGVDDAEACVAVVAALPDYFTASTHDEVRRDLPMSPAWVAEDEGGVVGFVFAPRRFSRAAEISFAAVVPDRRDQGVGSALVGHALEALAADGVVMVEVKALDASGSTNPTWPPARAGSDVASCRSIASTRFPAGSPATHRPSNAQALPSHRSRGRATVAIDEMVTQAGRPDQWPRCHEVEGRVSCSSTIWLTTAEPARRL